MAEQFRFPFHVAGVDHLLHGTSRLIFRRDLDLQRLMQETRRQLSYRWAEGCGEQQGLPLFRQQSDQSADVMNESHVEHAIRLIQHKALQLIKTQHTLLMQIEQSSRCCHQQVDTFL